MRLIDADKLKDEVLKWLPSDPCGIEEKEMPYETDIVASLLMEIKEAPTIEIIRCRECKYDGTWKCPWRNTQVPRYPSADDFCSYGEREDE